MEMMHIVPIKTSLVLQLYTRPVHLLVIYTNMQERISLNCYSTLQDILIVSINVMVAPWVKCYIRQQLIACNST